MKPLASLLVKGLSAILPISVVLFFIFRIGSTAEHALGELLKTVLPERIYLPGMSGEKKLNGVLPANGQNVLS